MSKIICDICGTTYPETSPSCPICGCTRDAAEAFLAEDLLEEDTAKGRGGRFSSKRKEIFDFDEVNSEAEEDDEEEDEEDYEDEEEEDEEPPRHNTFVVILLTILIAGLLIAAGFIFIRYFLPNIRGDETIPQTTAAQIQETVVATTEPAIPCESLIMSNATIAQLSAEGQHFLLNIKALPENTTDKIIYTSADESIATVTEDGRITAVSEGETTVYIACGKCTQECRVVVQYVEETIPPTTEPVVEETGGEVEETQASEVTPSVNSNIKLKLKKTDIRLGVYYQFTLELDCDLEQNEVEWSSEHPHIASVDENGVVTAVKWGTTAITAKYGDQTVQCIVRCV